VEFLAKGVDLEEELEKFEGELDEIVEV